VIVYSGYVPLMQEGALGNGADAYLAKSDDDSELVATIRRVAGAE
jgi:DNA-binding NarL/FixJ family response regulator